MGQPDQTVALRIATGEQGSARRRAQRRCGMRAGEEDALCGQLIEPRARNVGVAVGAEIPAEVVPMHEQHIVSWRGHCLSFLVPSVHRTVPMGIRQPFGSRRATYPQCRIHPQVELGFRCLGGVWSLGSGSFAHMFDGSLPEIGDLAALDDAALVDAVAGWARTENASCARKLAVMAEMFARRTGLPAGEREEWWVDPEAAVGAELGAAQNVSAWMALAQAHRGVVLADRLPRIAALFAAGLISEVLVRAIEYRTALVTDDEAIAQLDALLAEQVRVWGPLSVSKIEHAIDAIVDEVDPAALRRSRKSSCQRDVQFGSPSDEAGYTTMWARLSALDGEVLKERVQEMARSVCQDDPRTAGERRSEALAAMAVGQQLACQCGNTDCPAAAREASPPATALIHLVAEAATVEAARAELADPTPPAEPDVERSVDAPAGPGVDDTAPADDAAGPPATAPAPPAFVIGAGVM